MLHDLAALVLTGFGLIFLVGLFLGLRILEGIARASGEKARPWVYAFYALVVVWFVGAYLVKKAYFEIGGNRCTAALTSVNALPPTEGLLDNSTSLTIIDIQNLLSLHKLQYVETLVQTDAQGRVRVSREDDHLNLPSIPNGEARYARFELAPRGDLSCLSAPEVKDLTDYPFAGPLCIGVTFSVNTTAPLVFEYSKKFSAALSYPQATLRDQTKGKVLASLPTVHESLRTKHPFRTHGFGITPPPVNCFEDPQGMLLSRLYGPSDDHLHRFNSIEIELSADFGAIRARESELPLVAAHLASRPSPAKDELIDVRHSDWSIAVERAKGAGWSAYKNGRLDLRFLQFRHVSKTLGSDGHLWEVMWHQDGVLAWSAVRSWTSSGGIPLIANFDEDGRLLWAARVQTSQAGNTCSYVPSQAALVGSTVHLSAQCEGAKGPLDHFELTIDSTPLQSQRTRKLFTEFSSANNHQP